MATRIGKSALGTGERYRIAETEIQGRKANYIRRNREYMKRRKSAIGAYQVYMKKIDIL